jgi:two-component sensor histidine kinase
VTWSLHIEADSRKLLFKWVERDGPPVEQPSKEGFGSRLLRRVLTSQIYASVSFDYDPRGFRARVSLPLPP